MLENTQNIRIFCDMAFIDEEWQSLMYTENNNLPKKLFGTGLSRSDENVIPHHFYI